MKISRSQVGPIGLVVVLLAAALLWWWVSVTPAAPAAPAFPHSPVVTPAAKPAASSDTKAPATLTTVSSIIAGLKNAGRFASLYSSTGVKAEVTGSGPYTVFVPADSAFALLAPGTINNLSAAQKKRLVEYHVVSGKMLDLDTLFSGTHTALSRDQLNFVVNKGVAYVNSAYSVEQYKASNGIVYVISAVLLPPQQSGTPTPR